MATVATYFASPERVERFEIQRQYDALASNPLVVKLLNCFPEPVVVLNRERQIVLANDKLAAMLEVPAETVLGARPGEVLNCIRWRDNPGGCGTGIFCRVCGAVNAVINSQQSHEPQVEECRLTVGAAGGDACLDLRVWATPLSMDRDYTVVALRDISDEKRRRLLERMFFHDVLNSLGGLRGLLEVWPDQAEAEAEQDRRMAADLADEILDQVRSGRDLLAAERGDLRVSFNTVDIKDLLMRVCVTYRRQTVADGKHIKVGEILGSTEIRTDEILIRRVLGNLVKNALEASRPGQSVTISFTNNQAPAFLIHNETAMPEDVRLQVFQRSFTTKPGPGRGIGTYSIKLLTERYLGGSVSFESTPARGTTFKVVLPK